VGLGFVINTKQQGRNGRFGPGLPRVSDGSPMVTGGAGSGESEIRQALPKRR